MTSFTIPFGCATSKFNKEPSTNETTGEDVFSINHSFEADIKSVFDMWVTPERFSIWLGPKGATMYFINVGVKEGESFNEMKPIVTVGWSESFDKLESLLKLRK